MDSQVIALSALAILAGAILKAPGIGLVLCVLAGPLFKGFLQPFLGQIDLTVFIFVVTAVSVLVRLVVERQRIMLPKGGFNFLILSFVTLLLASVLYTPLPGYGLEIFLRFAILDLSVLYLVFMWTTDQKRVKRLLSLFAWIGLTYGTIMFIGILLVPGGLVSSHQFRAVLSTTPPISVALILTASILIALTLVITQSIEGRVRRWTLLTLTILSTAELIALNCRGPLIAFIVGLTSLLVILSRARKWRHYAGLGIILLIGAGIMAFHILPSQYTARYGLILNLESSSISARVNAWKFVVDHFDDWFLSGAGLFGFAYHYTGKTEGLSIFGSYPHNLFLDVFSDSGIVGLSLFVTIIGYILLQVWLMIKKGKGSTRALAIASFIGFIALLVNSLFSMSIIDTRLLWFIGGSILALRRGGLLA